MNDETSATRVVYHVHAGLFGFEFALNVEQTSVFFLVGMRERHEG